MKPQSGVGSKSSKISHKPQPAKQPKKPDNAVGEIPAPLPTPDYEIIALIRKYHELPLKDQKIIHRNIDAALARVRKRKSTR